MKETKISWPAEFPPPVECGKLKRNVCLSPDELQKPEDIEALVHDLFWFPDDFYYIFGEANKGLGYKLASELEEAGISIELTQRCFYRRPNPGYKNDFAHLLPGQIQFDWQRTASEGLEYSRFTIALTLWKRKELDMAYSAEVNARRMEASAPIFEAKPGYAGFSIDLVVVFSRIRSWWKNKRA